VTGLCHLLHSFEKIAADVGTRFHGRIEAPMSEYRLGIFNRSFREYPTQAPDNGRADFGGNAG
jgi:hypothetical protein